MRRPSSPLPNPTGASDAPLAGLWTIDDYKVMTVERFDVGPMTVFVPTEDVLLLAVPMPIPNPRRRLEALPFAIEDRIAQPLTAVHAALGQDLGGQTWLAGIVSRERMEAWTALLAEAGLDRATLVPDVLALPVPAAGAWRVDVTGGRALVRVADGTGFALPGAHLVAAWRSAGLPPVLASGDPLPAEIASEPVGDEGEPLSTRLATPALDLRQGAYARARRGLSPVWRRVAIVAAAGALAHAGIAAADTLALDHIASEKAAETRTLVQQAAPGATIGDDLATSVADILPASGPGPSPFLPLLGRVAGALKPLGADVRIRNISYDGAAGTMSVEVESGSLAGLQQAGSAFTSAGLNAQSGAASQSEGRAVGAFLIRSGA